MLSYSIIRKDETNAAHISLCSDGIIRVMFKRNEEIDAIVLKDLFDKIIKLICGLSYAFIYCAEDGSVTFTTEGNAYSKKNQHLFPKICSAFVTNSLAQRLIANFYLRIHKPEHPSKLFKTKEEAEIWCFEQIKKFQ